MERQKDNFQTMNNLKNFVHGEEETHNIYAKPMRSERQGRKCTAVKRIGERMMDEKILEEFEKMRCPQCNIFFCSCVELKDFLFSSLATARVDERERFLNQKANQHDQEIRKQALAELGRAMIKGISPLERCEDINRQQEMELYRDCQVRNVTKLNIRQAQLKILEEWKMLYT